MVDRYVKKNGRYWWGVRGLVVQGVDTKRGRRWDVLGT